MGGIGNVCSSASRATCHVSRVLNCKMTGHATMQMWNMWIVFTFIGLWHDLMWRWLAWAWLNVIFFSIELGIKGLVKKVFYSA